MKIHGTAKGGALSTKDFGVAFLAAATPAEELCQPLASDYAMTMYRTTNRRLGVKLLDGSTWIGKTITAVKFWLMWNGSGGGDVYGRVYRDGTTDPIITFGSKEISEINTGVGGSCGGGCNWDKVTFTGGGSYTLLEDDIICVENPNDSPTILFSDPYFDGVENYLLQMRSATGASWVEATGESFKLCIN